MPREAAPLQETVESFLRDLVGGDDLALLELTAWAKQLLTDPQTRPARAVVLCGPPDCGKSLFALLVVCALGRDRCWPNAFLDRLSARRELPALVVASEPAASRWSALWARLQRDAFVEAADGAHWRTHVLAMPETFERGGSHVAVFRCAAAREPAALRSAARGDRGRVRRALLACATGLRAEMLWARLRAYWRARWIAVFWHAQLASQMAAGGRLAARDLATFAAELGAQPPRPHTHDDHVLSPTYRLIFP